MGACVDGFRVSSAVIRSLLTKYTLPASEFLDGPEYPHYATFFAHGSCVGSIRDGRVDRRWPGSGSRPEARSQTQRNGGGESAGSDAAGIGEGKHPANIPRPIGQDACADSRAEKSTETPLPGGDVRVTFNFRFQPWQDVLDWFADQAGLSLLMESPPPGTFNYRDSRSYTPAEALDVLNGVLLTKGYTLVRRERMLVVVNLEDGIPPNLVPDVPLDDSTSGANTS